MQSVVNKLSVIKAKLMRCPVPVIVVIAYGINVGVAALFGYVLFPNDHSGPDLPLSLFNFTVVVIIGPLMETCLYQHLVIFYVKKYLKRYWIGILLSVTLFAVSHYYSWHYVFKTAVTGAVYAIVYVICAIRKKSPILYVTAVHGLHNLTGYCIEYLF